MRNNGRMLRVALTLLAALAGTGHAGANGLTFDYKDPKGISAISLALDSPLEPIVGYAKGLSGTITFDPANPKATTGRIAVDVDSIQFAHEGYTATARGYALEGEKYPQIFFTLRKVLRVTKPALNVTRALVLADFTCHGITTPLQTLVTASYFPGAAEERTNGKFKGDVLVLRTHFNVSRTRQGISKNIPAHMVGDTVEVSVAVAGIHYVPQPEKTAKPRQAVEKPQTNRLWKMEVERRDDPLEVYATFDLNASTPHATFTTATGSVKAEDVKWDDRQLTFHLPDNALLGALEGEITFQSDRMQGFLRGSRETLRFHGRPEQRNDDRIAIPRIDKRAAQGFRDLKIVADGKTWTLAERMRFYHVPAVSLARIEHFHVAEVGAFGVTNVETGEPVNAHTLFQAGGMGSPLVNLLAVRLAAQGRLNLGSDVNACLKVAKIPENGYTRHRKIKVLDLINGASGLTQYKFTGYRPGVNVPTLTALLNGADPAEMETLTVEAEPGTFTGAGINGAILEQVIVDATGNSLPALMQTQLFAPLGMTHSTYRTLPVSRLACRAALGHYATGELTLDRAHIYPEAGETGLWTTAGDFARALCQIQLLLAGKPNRLLPPQQNGLRASVLSGRWILGLIPGKPGDFLPANYAYHGGASYGYYANHATHLKEGYGVVVMENRNLGWQLNNEIIRAVAVRHGWERK